MKLYTEEQVIQILYWMSPTYIGREQIEERIKKELKPIELPSDEDIDECETNSPYDRIDEYNYGFIDGANWVKQFIINQNK